MNEGSVYDAHEKPKKYSPRKSRLQRRFNNWREKNDWGPYTMEEALTSLKLGNHDPVVCELIEEVNSGLNGNGNGETIKLLLEAVTLKTAEQGKVQIRGCQNNNRNIYRATCEREINSDYRKGMALLNQPFVLRKKDYENLLEICHSNYLIKPDYEDPKTGKFCVLDFWLKERNDNKITARTVSFLETKLAEMVFSRELPHVKDPVAVLEQARDLVKRLKDEVEIAN